MVDRGVTRVRRYVVERPVEQDVTLRGERVTIERRRPIETTSRRDGLLKNAWSKCTRRRKFRSWQRRRAS